MKKTTILNIHIYKNVKEVSEKVLNDLGINMTTAINMFLREVIRVNGIPFVIKENLNKETIETIEDSIRLTNDNSKGYSNIDDLKRNLDA